MKKLEIDWIELDFAFDNSSYEIDFYLDTESGKVLTVTDETRGILKRIVGQYGSAEEGEAFDLASALDRAGVPDWQQQAVVEVQQIEADIHFRYLEIPKRNSREDYGIMRDFIETVENERLVDQLQEAIIGLGAFRAFKSVLSDYPEGQERWYAYREQRLREEMLEWLEMEEIEPTNLDV